MIVKNPKCEIIPDDYGIYINISVDDKWTNSIQVTTEIIQKIYKASGEYLKNLKDKE